MSKSNEDTQYTAEEALQAASELIEKASDDRVQTHDSIKDAFNKDLSQLVKRQPPVVKEHAMLASCSEEFDIVVSNLKMINLTLESGVKLSATGVKSTKDKLGQVIDKCLKR
jgi:hypothetical protein